jgi:hypothetical protein
MTRVPNGKIFPFQFENILFRKKIKLKHFKLWLIISMVPD